MIKIEVKETVQLSVPLHQVLLDLGGDNEAEAFLQFMDDADIQGRWDKWCEENKDAWGLGS